MRAVDGVSFDLARGETLGIVGESGCGKSVTALSILRLIPPRPAASLGGSIRFEGEELTALAERGDARLRGNRISMIFQEPMTSLNPVLTVGTQIAENVVRHHGRAVVGGARAGARDARPGAHRRCAAGGSTSIRTSSPAACASAS